MHQISIIYLENLNISENIIISVEVAKVLLQYYSWIIIILSKLAMSYDSDDVSVQNNTWDIR
jgi:hypothetical protein